MKRTPATYLLLALVLALLTWFVLALTGHEAPLAPPSPNELAAGGGQPVDVPDRSETSAGTAAAETVAAATRAAALAETSLLGLRVRVIDQDQQPVAGAAIEVTGEDPDLVFPLTDADGIARAQRFPEGDVGLRARRGSLTGTWRWRWSVSLQKEVTIRVRSDRPVRVTVQDAAGQPLAGVEVGLARESQQLQRIPASLRAVTGDDGTAEVVVDGAYASVSWAKQVVAVAATWGRETVSAPVAWQEDGVTEIVLQAVRPPTPDGAVLTVRFLDEVGAPVDVRGTLFWSSVTAQRHSTMVGTVIWPSGKCEVDGSVARIPGLADGVHLKLSLTEDGRLPTLAEAQLPPGAPAFEVNITRGQSEPRLEIPLVDTHGSPVTEGKFVVYTQASGNMREQLSLLCEPDASGVLHTSLHSAEAGKVEIARKWRADLYCLPTEPRVVRPYNSTFGLPPVADPVVAVRQYPGVPAGEVHRLQAVVVRALHDMVRGQVVDLDGKPVAGVRILIATAAQPELPETKEFVTRSDRDGRFVIRSTEPLPAGTMVCGRCVLGYCPPVAVPADGAAIELQVKPAGALQLDVRRPSQLAEQIRGHAIARSNARFTLTINKQQLPPGWSALFPDDQGSGTWDAVGRWAVSCYMREDELPRFDDLVPFVYDLRGYIGTNLVLAIDGIRVVSGETCRPEMLRGQVVGEDLKHVSVRVVDGLGAPVVGARVRFHLSSWQLAEPNGVNAATDKLGEAWFVMPRGTVTDVEVHAQGYATRKIAAAVFPIEVVMGAGTTFDLTLAGHETLGNWVRGLAISASRYSDVAPDTPLQGIDREHPHVGYPNAPVDVATGKGQLANLPPGNYRLWLSSYPPIYPNANRSNHDICFVMLGDFVVEAGQQETRPVVHELTAAQLAVLQGR